MPLAFKNNLHQLIMKNIC